MKPDRCIQTYVEKRPCILLVDEIACIYDSSGIRTSYLTVILKSGYKLTITDDNFLDKIEEVNKIEKEKLNKKNYFRP